MLSALSGCAENNPYFQKIANDSRESLQGRFNQLTQEARKNLQRLHNAIKAMEEKEESNEITVDIEIYPIAS